LIFVIWPPDPLTWPRPAARARLRLAPTLS
jgi:hypothetical protein